MKKILLSLALFTAGSCALVNAQVDTKNIGARISSGIEFSYQHPLTDRNRMEFDAGLGFLNHTNWFGGDALYQWVFPLDELAEGFNWYLGAGGGVALFNSSYVDVNNDRVNNYGFNFSADVQAGIEYNFTEIPLQLSLDFRPKFWFLSGADPAWFGLALGVRYKF